MESGLSFIEFNYQLLQAYDFLHLYRNHDCVLQCGGNDQWGNILAGVELIRRVADGQAYALTFPLLTTASGAKMGKTASGAIWLDADRLSPYDFYQFWINTADEDVVRFLKIYTFLPLEQIEELGQLQGAEIRKAKEVLAYEVTRLTHGKEEAQKARQASRSLFGGAAEAEAVPSTEIAESELAEGIPVTDLFNRVGLSRSKSAARRLIQQGGAYVNEERVGDVNQVISTKDLEDGAVLLRAGKKRHHRVEVT
jgi:tyrosyl-tRNA synthetase